MRTVARAILEHLQGGLQELGVQEIVRIQGENKRSLGGPEGRVPAGGQAPVLLVTNESQARVTIGPDNALSIPLSRAVIYDESFPAAFSLSKQGIDALEEKDALIIAGNRYGNEKGIHAPVQAAQVPSTPILQEADAPGQALLTPEGLNGFLCSIYPFLLSKERHAFDFLRACLARTAKSQHCTRGVLLTIVFEVAPQGKALIIRYLHTEAPS
jgi:hypothetical protein